MIAHSTTGMLPGLTPRSPNTAGGQQMARPHATEAKKLTRIEQTLKVILYGGQLDDLRQFAVSEGWEAVSDSTLNRYWKLAFAVLKRRKTKSRRDLLARHDGSRRVIFARAMEAGDWK